MSTISGISSASDTWPQNSVSRGGHHHQDKLFEKVDADGSGGVDSTELQGLLDDVADKTGTTAAKASDSFSQLDTDGNGTLDASELHAAVQSLLPPPSTVDFAQSRSGETSTSTSTSATEGIDADTSATLDKLFDAVDTNHDGTLSTSETDALRKMIEETMASLSASSSSTADSASSGDSTSDNAATASTDAADSARFDLQQLARLVLQQYRQVASNSDTTTSASKLSAVA